VGVNSAPAYLVILFEIRTHAPKRAIAQQIKSHRHLFFKKSFGVVQDEEHLTTGKPFQKKGRRSTTVAANCKSRTTRSFPFIEGDGTGRDIWKASRRVFDAAVELLYAASAKLPGTKVFAGEKVFNAYKEWLPTIPSKPSEISACHKVLSPRPVGAHSFTQRSRYADSRSLFCERPVRYSKESLPCQAS